MSNPGASLFVLFVVSWLLHLSSRLPVLGVLRFDLLLVLVLFLLALGRRDDSGAPRTRVETIVAALFAYAVVAIPLGEWPGSALWNGVPEFLKALVFCWFSIAFLQTESDLRRFVGVFAACQLLRVLEPLYLHLAEGYWGSIAYMAGGEEAMDRLAGAPHDVVNPNGLGYLVCVALLFLWAFARQSRRARLLALAALPPCLYVLMLTGSRTGLLSLGLLYVGLLVRAKRRLALAVVGIAVAGASLPLMSRDLQDRYLSIVSSDTRNAATAQGRFDGLAGDLQVALRRPIFGHGLGTSAEANANFGGSTQRSHNLLTETMQELGAIGVLTVLALIGAIWSLLWRTRAMLLRDGEPGFLPGLVDALQIWWLVTLLLGAASYGLSSYEWYLLAGLSVVAWRQAHRRAAADRPLGRRALLYLDFEGALRDPRAGSPAVAGIAGMPVPGAIEFLNEAARCFDVVVCSPLCRFAAGRAALVRWLAAHGAAVESLRIASGREAMPGRHVDRVVVTPGQPWPTMSQLGYPEGAQGHDR